MDMRQELEGSLLDNTVRVGAFVAFNLDGVFEGELPGGRPVLVRILPEEAATGPVLDRYLEAQFFDHPALSRCIKAGHVALSGGRALYSVFEAPGVMLGQLLQDHGRLTPEEARSLGLDLAAGLAYLHERGLVHCGLHPWAVLRVGSGWKIADYAQMRLAGGGYAAETRKLMARHWLAPPEAFQGYVTPGWDSWELAQLLRISLEGLPETRKGGEHPAPRMRGEEAPEPFRSMFASCLAPDPGQRCTLQDIARALTLSSEPISEPVPAAPMVTEDHVSPALLPATAVSSRTRLAAALAGVLAGLVLLSFLVQDSPKRPAASETSQAASAPPSIERPQESGRARVEAQPMSVDAVVTAWAGASRAGDLTRQATYYAPLVWRFFNVTNVSRDWVRSHRQRELSKYGGIKNFEIDNVQSKVTKAGRATVTFDKTWAYAAAGGTSGKVRAELQLKQTGEGWKIVSERDLRTYWVKKGSAR